MNRASIGTDPEFFIRRKKDGKFISAIPHIEGTKENPTPLKSGGNIQFDNVAVEFATDPANNGEDLVTKVGNALREVVQIIPEGHEIIAIPSANFDADQLECEESQRFGCDPDYDAWELKVNDAPFCSDETLRTCGGHIHVGYIKGQGNKFLLDPYGKANTIKIMDVFHGIVSVILDCTEEAVTRRKLYGKAGCHRPVMKDNGGLYDGVEYRVLSNFWFKAPDLVMLMESLKEDVLKVMREMDFDALINDIGEERIKSTINEGVVAEAKKIFTQFVSPLLSEDSLYYFKASTEKLSKEICFTTEWQLET